MLGSSEHHPHFYFSQGKSFFGTASTRKPGAGRGDYGSALGIAGTKLLAAVQNVCLDLWVTQFQENSATLRLK
jgi:hypothetical protein